MSDLSSVHRYFAGAKPPDRHFHCKHRLAVRGPARILCDRRARCCRC